MNGVPRRPMHGSVEGGMDGGFLPHYTAGLPAPACSIKASIPTRLQSQAPDLGGWYNVTEDDVYKSYDHHLLPSLSMRLNSS